MKKAMMLALAAVASVCYAESYGSRGAFTGKIGTTYTHQMHVSRKQTRSTNTAAVQSSKTKIERLEKQIALNEKKIAENAEIERKTNYKGTTSFSTRDKTSQNIKLKKKLAEERAKLRKMAK